VAARMQSWLLGLCLGSLRGLGLKEGSLATKENKASAALSSGSVCMIAGGAEFSLLALSLWYWSMDGASSGVISWGRGLGFLSLASGHGCKSDSSGVRCYRGKSTRGIVWRGFWEARNNFGAAREVLRSSEGR